MTAQHQPQSGTSVTKFVLWIIVISGFTASILLAGYLLGAGATNKVDATQASKTFFDSVSPPIWIILFLNVASFLSAVVAAFAAIKVTPQTSREVADLQATVARESINVAASSADAAALSAQAANRSSDNQGIHSVARLRQEWINELRGRIAEAHALLLNWRVSGANSTDRERLEQNQRVIKASELMARIELLLNPEEMASQALLASLQALTVAPFDPESRRVLGRDVIAAGQSILKTEWDRVRGEMHGKLPLVSNSAKSEEV